MNRILCPQCGHTLKYAAMHVGKKVRCQKCYARFLISPDSPAPAQSVSAPSRAGDLVRPPPPPDQLMPLPRDFRPGPPDFPARSPFDFTEESIPEAIPVTDEAIPEAIPVTNESPLERYGRELGIGWKALSPVLIGGVCLLLLGLITLFPWASVQIGDKELEAYYGELLSETWTGLETSQGRVIGTVTVIAAGALGLGLFLVRRHLPACLLVAGASGTVSVILLFSYWRNVHARMAETAEYLNMPLMKSVGLGKLRGGIQSPFYVAVLLAIAVAATFVFASLLKPLKLPFLRNTGAGPLVEKHGGLIGAQALAVLIGLIFFVVFS